jgi:MFS family permease
MAFGYAVTTPIAQTLLSRLSDPLDQASNLGIGQSMASLARAVGPLAGGFLFQHVGTPYPFWMAALLLLLATALAGRVPALGSATSVLAMSRGNEVGSRFVPGGSLATGAADGPGVARGNGEDAEAPSTTVTSRGP